MYEAENGCFTLALVGDTIPTRRLSVFREDRFLALREILRSADACFANLEAPVHRYRDGGHWQNPVGGTYMTTEPRLLEDLKWMGITILACGSSHAEDYGPEGIIQTIDYLEAAGLAHAGSGRNLAEARAPTFVETPRGRVALVAASVPHSAGARAGEQRRDSLGFPGVNGLRYETSYCVSQASMDALVGLSKDLGWHSEIQRRNRLGHPDSGSVSSYNFLDRHFDVAEECAIRTRLNDADLEDNVKQIAYAREVADRVVVSLHCHEQGGPTFKTADRRSEVSDLADFARQFAYAAIDAGADVFVAHGPQAQLGIEIYKGRPIFNGIGSFVFELELVQVLPHEAYERYGLGVDATPADFYGARYAGGTRGHPADRLQWEQAVFECDFVGPEFEQIRIHPIDLGFGKSRTQRGRPLLAEGEVADRVIERITDMSERLGTKVKRHGTTGIVTA